MRESELLLHIFDRSRSLRERDQAIVLGPGDDAAVVRTPAGDHLLLTVDQLVEGRHFAPGTPPDAIARKAIARSLSDIAAMGGRPRWALATGLLPANCPYADELFDALARWALHWSCPLVGGDIATWNSAPKAADRLVLTVTIIGEARGASKNRPPRVVRRSGARLGDSVYVTGALGGSLASGRHLSFEPRLAESAALLEALGDRLHAMIDISDGLGRDAGRIAASSNIRLELDAARIPRHKGVRNWRSAAADGEDYELLFTTDSTVPVPAVVAGTPVTLLGRVVAGQGCVIVEKDGTQIDATDMGWNHGQPAP